MAIPKLKLKMKLYELMIAREISEYTIIEIAASSKAVAKREAMRRLTEASEELDNCTWEQGNETSGERVCTIEET